MMQVRVSGKVMLSGEYAVLYGGTAVMVPVPRYLTLTAIDEPGPDANNPVLREALNEPIPELAKQEQDLAPLHVEVDRSEFTVSSEDGTVRKLGLGGSAAEAVAAIALRYKRCDIDWTKIPEKVYEYADRAHRRAQNGVGSGADVAAIAYRQPIRFRRHDDHVVIEVIPQPASHLIPRLTLLWSGEPANTRDLVNMFQQWAHDYPNADALITILITTADKLAQEWFTSETPALFHAIEEFTETLESLSDLAEMPWRIQVHRQIHQWVRENVGVAKPTGAGGGDMILLVGDIPAERRSELTISLDPFANV